MVKCAICKNSFKFNKSLANHVRMIHKLGYLDYSIQFNQFKKPCCSICKEYAEYKNSGLRFGVTCGKEECKKKHAANRHYSVETREKSRKNRFNYLKKKLGETAWERRNKGKMSYLEQWFFDKVVLEYNLLLKFDIINEYPEYPYFIDFAFLNIKVAVELDGKQHFRNLKNQNRDIKKSTLLAALGWKIYRIRFDELNEEKIKEFLKVIYNPGIYNNKILEPKLFKFYSSKKIKSEEKSKKIKETYYKQEKDNIDKVKECNIDFSKFGWVTKVAFIINKQPQKINSWMKKYLPDILESAFKRGNIEKTPKRPIPFSNIEKIAKEKGYYLDGDNIKNKRGRLVKKYDTLGYSCISILLDGKIKHLRLHRFKAYLLYGDKIYEKGTKVIFKTNDKHDISDDNISLN